MTDTPDSPDAPGDADAGDEEISALLASLRVSEPMPADVAARLDRTLAGLGPVPGASAPGAPGSSDDASATPARVVPLRRRVATGLVAVAAAVVVVLGTVGLLRQQSTDSGAAGSRASQHAAAPSASSSSDASAGTSPDAARRAPEGVAPSTAASGVGGGAALRAMATPVLTRAGLRAQVRALVPSIRSTDTAEVVAAGCLGTRPSTPGDRAVRVLLDGQPAALLAPGGDPSRALLLGCPAPAATGATPATPTAPAGRVLARVAGTAAP